MTADECSAAGCGEAARARGMCNAHYQRFWRQENSPFTTLPVCCARLTSKVSMAEDDLRRAARAATSRATDRRIAAVTAAKEVVQRQRVVLDDHLKGHAAGANGGEPK